MVIKADDVSLGELLKSGNVYSVPIFQRSYAWGDREINDFLEDLESVLRNDEKEYFFGSMVFTPCENKNKQIILDGQQRLATVILFLAALRDVLREHPKEENIKRANKINELIYSGDPIELSEKVKIELNREDRSFFEAIIIKSTAPNVRYESHKLIKKAYETFKDHIRGRIGKDEEYPKKVLDVILKRFKIIKIEVDNDLNAHLIFETLNDRGLELSIADLIKNYVFFAAGPYLDEVIGKWKEIVDNVGDHNVSKFIRHYWCSTRDLVRKDEVYKRIKSSIRKHEEIRSLINDLSEEGLTYSNIFNPTHEFWGDKETEDLLNELNVLGAEQVLILLLAIYKRYYKHEREKFKKLLKILVNFTFRYSTICDLNPNEIERVYSEIAIKLRKKEFGVEETIKRLRELNPDDMTFIKDFSEKCVKNTKLAKYILFKINDYLLKEKGEKEKVTDINRVNLEHIIPKKPDDEWKKFLKEKSIELEKWVHRLGNMTILCKEYNRKIANKFFTKKKEMYMKSTLPINDDLKEYEEFGQNEIIKRQEKMAKIAKEIWKL
jgi:uncharacterized protein with ParB-like and HNH nuclease domain